MVESIFTLHAHIHSADPAAAVEVIPGIPQSNTVHICRGAAHNAVSAENPSESAACLSDEERGQISWNLGLVQETTVTHLPEQMKQRAVG